MDFFYTPCLDYDPTPFRASAQSQPSDQFRANGRNVSYHVLLKWPPDRRRHDVLCDTVRGHCAFNLPQGATRVCITASNSAGESVPMWVPVYRHTGTDRPSLSCHFCVSAHTDTLT